MKKVIIDTNAIMAIAEFGLDLFTELQKTLDFPYSLSVLEGTIQELEKIRQEQRGKFKQAAALGLVLLKSKRINIIKSAGAVDDLLLAFSRQGAWVLTQDSELKQQLHKPYLTIRQKKKVVMIG